MCGFPKIKDTFLEVPIIRVILFWGLSWVPPRFRETTIYIYIYTHTLYI